MSLTGFVQVLEIFFFLQTGICLICFLLNAKEHCEWKKKTTSTSEPVIIESRIKIILRIK